jgi:uncharacterized protein YecA (UPF0149 family)
MIMDAASNIQFQDNQSPQEAMQTAMEMSPAKLQSLMMRYQKPKQKVREYHVGRNEKCPCGSGKKYKHCCLESGKYEELVDARK